MHQNPTRHFGAQVAALIKAKGLTYEDVTQATGIAAATLSRRLNDPDMTFRLSELARVAALLDTTAGAIVTEFEEAA